MSIALASASLPWPAARCMARPLAASDIRLEIASTSEVLSLWPKDPRATESPRPITADRAAEAMRLAISPAYKTLRWLHAEQFRCLPSDKDFARAILYPESLACGISLDAAFRARSAIDSVLAEVSRRDSALRQRIAAEVGRYLPDRSAWGEVRVSFVLSSRWSFDAATTVGAETGAPTVIVNVSEVLDYGNTARQRVDVLSHVLAHEVFHAGMRQMENQLPGWIGYGRPTSSPFAYVARVMLDEGVAHYIDWRTRAGADTLFTGKPRSRETRAFQQLQLAAKHLRDQDADPGARDEVLEVASTGSLWSKYGAISGMFAAYRIESRLGLDSLRAAVIGGPGQFLRMYGRVSAADTSLQRVPMEFTLSR